MERRVGTYKIDGHTMEYSIAGKEGEPIFVMHGGHSNCYEEFGYASLIGNGFKVITPSRAGYGCTSKEIGDSLDKACYYYAELLNYLKIDKVHVLAISAGGPSGLCFASQYPEKVKTLTLQSAVTKEWHTPTDRIYKVANVLFHPFLEKWTWKLTASVSNHFPTFMFKQMVPSFSKCSFAQIKDKIVVEDIEEVRKMNNRQRSGAGFLIDLSQTKATETLDLSTISSPTLIMHSKYDGAVSLVHAKEVQQKIFHSQLCIFDSWGHLLWIGKGSEEIKAKLTDFLTLHSKTS